jgi:hypothetical protein
MPFELPREYIVLKFFQYGVGSKHNKFNDSYQCGCPICREGNSIGRKQRCYYIPSNNNIYCHNCGWSSSPLNWVKEAGNLSFNDVIDELKDFDVDVEEYIERRDQPEKKEASTLPKDCINLLDELQVEFFKNNNTVKRAINIIKSRKLDTAVNRPKALYVSLNDNVHKDRLVIPFYDSNGEIVFYQSRSIFANDTKPKYISKVNSTKSLYGFDNIDASLDDVFIFEGPINSFFVNNGLAVAGIQEKSHQSFTRKQEEQLSALKLFRRIWVLDSQWVDSASLSKSKILADQNETLFIWPENIGRKYKDFNDLAIKFNLNELSAKFITDNSYKGMGAKIALEAISMK